MTLGAGLSFALASKISLGRCLNFRSEWTQRGRVELFAIIIVCGLASGMQVVFCARWRSAKCGTSLSLWIRWWAGAVPASDLLDGCGRSSWKLALAMASWHHLASTMSTRIYPQGITGHPQIPWFSFPPMKLPYLGKPKCQSFSVFCSNFLRSLALWGDLLFNPGGLDRDIMSNYIDEPCIDTLNFSILTQGVRFGIFVLSKGHLFAATWGSSGLDLFCQGLVSSCGYLRLKIARSSRRAKQQRRPTRQGQRVSEFISLAGAAVHRQIVKIWWARSYQLPH